MNDEGGATIDYARLARVTQRALSFFKLPEPTERVGRVVIDFSFGLQPAGQPVARIAGQQLFIEVTGMSKGRVSSALSDLECKRMLKRWQVDTDITGHEFQDDWRQWKASPRLPEWSNDLLLASLIEGATPQQRYARALGVHGGGKMLFDAEDTYDDAIKELRRARSPQPIPPQRGSVDEFPGGELDREPVPVMKSNTTLVTGTGRVSSTYPHFDEVPRLGTEADLLAEAERCLGVAFVERHGGLLRTLCRPDPQHPEYSVSICCGALQLAIGETKVRLEDPRRPVLSGDGVIYLKRCYRQHRKKFAERAQARRQQAHV